MYIHHISNPFSAYWGSHILYLSISLVFCIYLFFHILIEWCQNAVVIWLNKCQVLLILYSRSLILSFSRILFRSLSPSLSFCLSVSISRFYYNNYYLTYIVSIDEYIYSCWTSPMVVRYITHRSSSSSSLSLIHVKKSIRFFLILLLFDVER